MIRTTAILTFLFAANAFAAPTKFTLDRAHSEVGFSVSHLMISKVTGKFEKFDSTFAFDEATGDLKDVAVKIDAASINTSDSKRDDHLKTADFFDVKKFPNIEFKSEKIEKKGKKPTKVHGQLTMHGVTKPVTLNVTYNGTMVDPWGNKKAGFEATGKLSRKDYGLTWNKALDKGGVAVGDEVTLRINGEATAEVAKADATKPETAKK